MRTIAGIINPDGSIDSGTGDFTSQRNSRGLYTITFNNPFPRVFGGSATQIFFGGGDAGNTRDNAVIAFLREGSLRVKTGDGDGDSSNRSFTFVVIGQD